MKLVWGHLAQRVREEASVLHLDRIFDGLWLEPGPGGNVMPPCQLAMMLHATEEEAREGEPVRLRLVDASGDQVAPPQDLPLRWNVVGPGHDLLGPAVLSLSGGLLPRAGVYRFEGRHRGHPVGGVQFVAAGAPSSAPGSRPAWLRRTGIRWGWGHVVDAFTWEADGIISLAGVMEFFTIPRGLDFLQLSGGVLVVMVSVGADDGPDHRVRVTLHDEGGRELASVDEGPLRCGSALAGYPLYCPFSVPLTDLVLPGPGTYSFRVSVDGRYVESVRLPVVTLAGEAGSGR